MKKFMSIFLCVFLVLSICACGGAGSANGDAKLVGVAMPNKAFQRWNQDGSNMKRALEEKGYRVELQYAENDVNTQVSQI
ncbi:MAG: ABC transporter substrate-binding protein, partial [Clostridia bacterium]|nr:ABC transporter substrate-binding protein [Clostridia bacterium]